MKKIILNLILTLILTICTQLSAQSYERDREKESKIEKQLELLDPSMVQTFKDATIAMDEDKNELADSLYSVVNAKVPNFDPLLRRLGVIKSLLGNSEEGIALCEKAVEINRSAYNLSTLAQSYRSLNDENNNLKAQQLFKEAITLPNGDELDILTGYVEASFALEDLISLKEGLVELKLKYPDAIATHYYTAFVLAIEERWKESKKEILKAKEMGLPQEEVDYFLSLGIRNEINKINAFILIGVIVGIWILGLLLLFIVGKLFSKLTLNAIENNQLETSSAKPGGWIRSGYKALVNIGGVYYYISLPIILALVVIVTLGIIYLFLIVGTIPIKLTIILIVAAVATIFSMIRSLLIKIDQTDPGRELKKEEAPELYHLTTEVAQLMGTRPIDEIRITPLNDLAVYEKGTWREKMHDKGKRILILGTAVLKDFKKEDFKAVIAHEYGHFTHRDTAGGEVAMRVQNDMIKYFMALQNTGQNTMWNIAFQFLRLYYFIFRRISHGATRLQEVLADRVAAETFGNKAFENGLTHVIRRDIEFNKYANVEIEEAIKLKRQINNLYALQGKYDADIEDELKKALNSKTTEDDTHPSPIDRFKYIAGIESKNTSQDETLVADLFHDWHALTDEMTENIKTQVRRNSTAE
jgi:Zn-dependent protease with chaperone function